MNGKRKQGVRKVIPGFRKKGRKGLGGEEGVKE